MHRSRNRTINRIFSKEASGRTIYGSHIDDKMRRLISNKVHITYWKVESQSQQMKVGDLTIGSTRNMNAKRSTLVLWSTSLSLRYHWCRFTCWEDRNKPLAIWRCSKRRNNEKTAIHPKQRRTLTRQSSRWQQAHRQLAHRSSMTEHRRDLGERRHSKTLLGILEWEDAYQSGEKEREVAPAPILL